MVVTIFTPSRANPPNPPSEITGRARPPRPDNIIKIVVAKKITNDLLEKDDPISRSELIKLTERLAEEAKSGTLKGIGGFAEYEDDYIFGLEGSYLLNPAAAILPLKRLERRIMDQVESEE